MSQLLSVPGKNLDLSAVSAAVAAVPELAAEQPPESRKATPEKN